MGLFLITEYTNGEIIKDYVQSRDTINEAFNSRSVDDKVINVSIWRSGICLRSFTKEDVQDGEDTSESPSVIETTPTDTSS